MICLSGCNMQSGLLCQLKAPIFSSVIYYLCHWRADMLYTFLLASPWVAHQTACVPAAQPHCRVRLLSTKRGIIIQATEMPFENLSGGLQKESGPSLKWTLGGAVGSLFVDTTSQPIELMCWQDQEIMFCITHAAVLQWMRVFTVRVHCNCWKLSFKRTYFQKHSEK